MHKSKQKKKMIIGDQVEPAAMSAPAKCCREDTVNLTPRPRVRLGCFFVRGQQVLFEAEKLTT